MTAPDRFLTVTEVAAALRVSRMTVYRLARIGRRNLRIPERALLAYLRKGGMTW